MDQTKYCNFGQFLVVSFAFIPNAKLIILLINWRTVPVLGVIYFFFFLCFCLVLMNWVTVSKSKNVILEEKRKHFILAKFSEELLKPKFWVTFCILLSSQYLEGFYIYLSIRRDETSDAHQTSICKQFSNLSNPTDVFFSIFWSETQILIKALANIVTIQRVAWNAMAY